MAWRRISSRYNHGMTGGEHQFSPAKYNKMLKQAPGTTNSNRWMTYAFNWQPDHVSWCAPPGAWDPRQGLMSRAQAGHTGRGARSGLRRPACQWPA